jgi:hypothetical protein
VQVRKMALSLLCNVTLQVRALCVAGLLAATI